MLGARLHLRRARRQRGDGLRCGGTLVGNGGCRAGCAAERRARAASDGCAGAGWPVRGDSVRTVRVGFEGADSFDQRVEFRRVVANDAGAAHVVVVRSQGRELIVVGHETQAAVEAVIVVGVAGVEEHLLVPDDVGEEFAVSQCGPADGVGGKAREIEPVAGEPVGTVGEPAAVAFDMDERRLLPEGALGRKDRHGRTGIVEALGPGGNVGKDRVSFVGIDDVAAAEFLQDIAPEIAIVLLDRGRIAEADGLTVVADVDGVAAVGRESLGGGVEGRRDDVADVARDAVLEPLAEPLGLGAARAIGKGVETVVDGPVVEGDVHVLGEPVDDAVDLRERRAALEGHRMGG